jgi:NADH:ubiquinone reductase (H+-translocating)
VTEQTSTKIVILGAGYAGMAAALRLAHKTRRLPVEITLVNGAPTFVERIRLHQAAADEHVRARSIPDLLRSSSVHFVQGWAGDLDPNARQITLKTETGSTTLAFDYLLYTLGSRTDKDSVPGVREHTLAVGNPGESEALRQRLAELAAQGQTGPRSVIVVGGGLTGIETATEVAERYPTLQVQLVTAGRVGPGLSERGRAYVRKTMDRLGVRVEENMRVKHVEPHSLGTADGRTLPFDLCIWAGPFEAQPLARAAGLAVNARGQILIDAEMRSIAAPTIYAAGDSAAFVPEVGLSMRMACATATTMAAHAADNLHAQVAGEPQQPFRFGYLGQCISLGRHAGLLQFVRPDDSPVERIVTGRPAAWIKEAICRGAALAVTTPWMASNIGWWGGERTPQPVTSPRTPRPDIQPAARQS